MTIAGMLNSVVECMDWGGQPTTVSVECERRLSVRNGSHVVSVDELPTHRRFRPYVCYSHALLMKRHDLRQPSPSI